MKIAYTICSANHLPFAKALGDSLIQHNPDYQFIIALADTFRSASPSYFAPHQVIPVQEMEFSLLEEMNEKYSIFELSCALKPFVANFLFLTNPSCQTLFYFDSDIFIFNSLSLAESALQRHSIILTPHISTPLGYDASHITELDVLRTGLYNAGFFGLERSETSFSFLGWWKDRLANHCYNDASNGLFVDQLWLDLVPLYYRDTFILFDPGYNLAYWNFIERKLDLLQESYVVNKTHPLVFFHFSGYDIFQPAEISKHQKRHSFEEMPHLKPLFENYSRIVLENNESAFLQLPFTMGKPKPIEVVTPIIDKPSIKQKLKRLFS